MGVKGEAPKEVEGQEWRRGKGQGMELKKNGWKEERKKGLLGRENVQWENGTRGRE
jgi:hypothetical protein